MSWIKTIKYDEAGSRLKSLYDRVKGPGNNIDNILLVHSLRPHTLLGHMTLYKNVLHHAHNTLPKWYFEALGVLVSHLNDRRYCVEHHLIGFTRLLNKQAATTLLDAIKKDKFDNYFEGRFLVGSTYAKKLTLFPREITNNDVVRLHKAGFSDGEILEVNQVVSYFNYANRTVMGLGVNLDGDALGYSPSDVTDPDNWNHT